MDARVRSNSRIGAPPFTASQAPPHRRFCRIGAERLSGLPVKIALTPRVGASPGEKGDFFRGVWEFFAPARWRTQATSCGFTHSALGSRSLASGQRPTLMLSRRLRSSSL
jgi:hypothetical protein